MAREASVWLSFRGVSSEAAGTRVVKLPAPPAAAPRGALVEIPGRDGALWQADGGSEGVTMKAVLRLKPGTGRESVAAWLSGAGPLVLSDDPARYFRARVLREVSFVRDGYGPGSLAAEATFSCEPFRYLLEESAVSLTAAGTFPGQGTEKARPSITVYGSGEITLMVNGCAAVLSGVVDHITLDCEAMMGLKDGANVSGQVALLGGEEDEWPRLKAEGETNAVSWTGSVSRVEIQPRWRWR